MTQGYTTMKEVREFPPGTQFMAEITDGAWEGRWVSCKLLDDHLVVIIDAGPFKTGDFLDKLSFRLLTTQEVEAVLHRAYIQERLSPYYFPM